MLPMIAVRKQLGVLLAADSTTLAPAVSANEIALIAAPFTPSEDLVIASLTLATFTGSAPKVGVTGAQGVGNDPATQDQIVTNLAPAGGWRFVCTAAPTPPQQIYGYALTTTATGALLAVALLPIPVTITNVGDEIDLGAIQFTFVLTPIS